MRRTLVVLLMLAGAGCGSDGGDAAEVEMLEVLGPAETGSGEVPHLEWTAIDGAAEYGVVVRDADGAAVWAWRGPETEVWFGGLSRGRPAGMGGPVVAPGSTWRVGAFDDDGHAIAISEERGLDPG